MITQRRRFKAHSSSLTLFSGKPEIVSNVLNLEMLRAHLEGGDQARTYYFDASMAYKEVCEIVRRTFRNKRCIFIFEQIHDERFCTLILNLVDSGSTVWAGINATGDETAILNFELLLSSSKQNTDLAQFCENHMYSAVSAWNRIKTTPATLEVVATSPSGFE